MCLCGEMTTTGLKLINHGILSHLSHIPTHRKKCSSSMPLPSKCIVFILSCLCKSPGHFSTQHRAGYIEGTQVALLLMAACVSVHLAGWAARCRSFSAGSFPRGSHPGTPHRSPGNETHILGWVHLSPLLILLHSLTTLKEKTWT